MLVAISPYQIGQYQRVSRVALCTRGGVPVAVAAGRERVDRIHPVASLDQRGHPHSPIGLDPDHHLPRIDRMLGHQRVQPADPGPHPPTAAASPTACRARLTQRRRDGPRPNHPRQRSPHSPSHRTAPLREIRVSEKNPGDLMDQCSTGTPSHQPYALPKPPAGAQSGSRGQASGTISAHPPAPFIHSCQNTNAHGLCTAVHDRAWHPKMTQSIEEPGSLRIRRTFWPSVYSRKSASRARHHLCTLRVR